MGLRPGLVFLAALAAVMLVPAAAMGADRREDNKLANDTDGRRSDRNVPERIIINPPHRQPFSVSINTDRNSYTVGQNVRLYFRTTHDAYVYIFNTDARGITRQIFPNYHDRNNFARAGSTYSIPDRTYALQVTGPAGSERVHIVAYKREWRALRSWGEFRSTDPFPRRFVEPDAMQRRIEEEARELRREGPSRSDLGRSQSLRIVPVPAPGYDPDFAEDYDFFTVRDRSYRPYNPPPAYPRQPYEREPSEDDYYRGWPPYEPLSRYDYDYRRPSRAYQPDPARATARVRVSTSVSGADVYIDGTYRGRTPGTFAVEPGRRQILVYHPEYGSRRTEIQVYANRTSAVSMGLTGRLEPLR